MMQRNYLFLREWAPLVGLSETRAYKLAQAGRVEGAKKIGRIWLIPNNQKRPAILPAGRPKAKVNQDEAINRRSK